MAGLSMAGHSLKLKNLLYGLTVIDEKKPIQRFADI
jgi:hypothetical protein